MNNTLSEKMLQKSRECPFLLKQYWKMAIGRRLLLLLFGVVAPDALADGALRRITQRQGIEHSAFRLNGNRQTVYC